MWHAVCGLSTEIVVTVSRATRGTWRDSERSDSGATAPRRLRRILKSCLGRLRPGREGMCEVFVLFELGSTSLKFYFRRSEQDKIHKATFPWDIGHEVYETGRISRES